MEVLNRAIESIMNSTDRDDWEPTVIHVTDNVLSLWKGEVLSSLHTHLRSKVTTAVFNPPALVLAGWRRALVGVSGTIPHLSGRRARQPHLCGDRRWRHAAVRMSRVLVRAGRRNPLRGRPGGVHGERSRMSLRSEPVLQKHKSA